jgi:acyl carrier protein phosphodiesterase
VADVYYDHLLACEWHRYYQQPLDIFCQDFYSNLGQYSDNLPAGALVFLRRAPQIGWLQSYAHAEHLPMILQRIGERLRRPVPLQNALPVINQHQSGIALEFHQLYPRLQHFMQNSLYEIELQ